MMSGSHLSKEFFELVKSIGESRSKQEEDGIIVKEMGVLKKKMSASNVTPKQMKELLVRMLYVEMLGHDASFGHIEAVKMVSNRELLMKRVGYLVCSLVLHSDHQFMLLLVNTIQTDLRSDNYLEVSMALTVVAKLSSAELVPVLLPLVAKCLDHAQANVRKKAVVVLHRFAQLDPSCVVSLDDKLRRVLCDKDPSVMGASLWLFKDLCAQSPNSYKDLVPSFVSILKQIIEHRLPREYDYHRIPAPWIQMQLLQVLACLGAADQKASEGMYEILHEVMKRADIGINVGFAIVYECVRTVTTIYPDPALIEDAAKAVSRFISADSHNLKYLGINALASIVQMNPKYAAEHQMVVIDCLEDPDETLQRKTLDLLYSMTNPANVVVIVDKLTAFLKDTVDVYLRSELVSRITEIAEKFAPNNEWYIQTMSNVFELGGDLVRREVVHSMMRLIAEGGDAEDDESEDIRVYAVNTYLELLKKPKIPDVLLQVAAFVLGEFAYLGNASLEEVFSMLAQAIERPHEDLSTRAWLLTALMKIVAHMHSQPPELQSIMQRYQKSLAIDLQQRAHEFAELVKDKKTMATVLPRGQFTDDIEIDESLSFLNGYVEEALANGAAPYNPPHEATASDGFDYATGGAGAEAAGASGHNGGGLKYKEYAPAVLPHVPVGYPTEPSGASAIGAAPVGFLGAESHGIGGGDVAAAVPGTGSGGIGAAGIGGATAAGGGAGLIVKKKGPWGPSTAQSPSQQQRDQGEPQLFGDISSSPQRQQQQMPEYEEGDQIAGAGRREESKRSLTQKEILAQGLFAGLSGTGPVATPSKKPVGAARRPKKAPSPTHQQQQQAAGQGQAQVPDLLPVDLFSASEPQAPLQQQQQRQQQSAGAPVSELDLLGSVFGSEPAPSFAAPQTAAPVGNTGGDLFDLFGSSSAAVQPQLLLSPETMTTSKFGALWKQMKAESKFSINQSSCTAPADYMQRVSSRVGAHPVETIGQEMICAGKLVSNAGLVLIHGKIKPNGRVDVLLKANNAADLQAVVPELKSVLS